MQDLSHPGSFVDSECFILDLDTTIQIIPDLLDPEMDFLDINLTKTRVFAPYYLQSLLMADFKENHTVLWL